MIPMSSFECAFAYTLGNEGGYVDDPSDTGGPTKWGITQKSLSEYLTFKVSPRDVQDLTLSTAKSFYMTKYWLPLSCNKMADEGIAIAIFDTGVLYGVGEAGILTQDAINLCGVGIVADGKMGPKTIVKLNQITRASFLENLITLIMHRIDTVIKYNPIDEKFRQGWENRASKLLTLNSAASFSIMGIPS